MEYRDYKGYRVYEDGRIQRIKTGNFIKHFINQKGYHFTLLPKKAPCFSWGMNLANN